MTAVTIVTAGAASSDTLTDQDYRDIYDELRSKCSLRQFAEAIGTQVSIAWWSKYERGEPLTRDRRQELRRAVGLPPLPPLVSEAVATADPDATVWQIGAGPADRIVMVGAQAHEPLAIRLNGSLQVVSDPAQNDDVTEVTPPLPGAAKRARLRNRPRYFRPCLSLTPAERIPQLEALLAAARCERA